MKEYDPCEHCPFVPCLKDGEERRWCFMRILALMAQDEREKKKENKE